MKNLKIIVGTLIITLSGCGTYSPIPMHGGGKRFAVEQLLISTAIRNVVYEIPVDEIKNKKIFLETSVIQDEGGGYTNGGRAYLSNQLDYRRQTTNTSADGNLTSLTQKGVNFLSQSQDRSYIKDFTFNSSDSRHLNSVLSSYLMRNNVMINPNPESEGDADYILEVIVDVLGAWSSKTDWFIKNGENLKAIVSAEFVITPLKEGEVVRKIGRISYQAEYSEKYIAWMGPVETSIKVTKSDVGIHFPQLHDGSSQSDNVRRKKPAEPVGQEINQTIQINPKLRQ
jgi:hypothetical protein